MSENNDCRFVKFGPIKWEDERSDPRIYQDFGDFCDAFEPAAANDTECHNIWFKDRLKKSVMKRRLVALLATMDKGL